MFWYKNHITFSSKDVQNMHLEHYLRKALKLGLTKCTFFSRCTNVMCKVGQGNVLYVN